MRRLPVYILVDTSGSMAGEPIEQVKSGVQMLVAALRQDPQALESVCVSIIEFNDQAKQSVPLTELASFNIPGFVANGTTSLGAALDLVASCADSEVRKSNAEQKGDWKPMLFLMSDGVPTDNWQNGLSKFRAASWGVSVACAVDGADTSVLKQVCNDAVELTTSDPSAISAFFKWVTASIQAASKSVDLKKKEIEDINELPPPPPEIKVVV